MFLGETGFGRILIRDGADSDRHIWLDLSKLARLEIGKLE